MGEFRCDTGNCVKCCTELELPLTIGDLYRAWRYSQEKGRGASFRDTFSYLTKGWGVYPAAGEAAAMPRSKLPCPNLDGEASNCSVYDAFRYVGCAVFPEDWLVEARHAEESSYRNSEQHILALPCVQGVTISDDRRERVLELRNLLAREGDLTVKLLRTQLRPSDVSGGKLTSRKQRELDRGIRAISADRRKLRILRENLLRNDCLQDYERLVLGEGPGFSYCNEI